jgi:Periplasmic copper-binding protein (NosD)/IPT/TIG domain
MRRVAPALLALLIAAGVVIGMLGRDSPQALADTPVVSGVSPNTGPASGGTTVTISGSGFSNCNTVSFGGATVQVTPTGGGTSITVTSPASPLPSPGAGAVNVTVGGGTCGTSATSPSDIFTYSGSAGGAGGAFTGNTFVVSPGGSDSNSCNVQDLAGGTPTNQVACATIQGAVNKTRDRDQVVVLPGTYDIQQPVEVPDLIAIFAGFSPQASPMGLGLTPYPISNFILALPAAFGAFNTVVCSGNNVKSILRSANGLPIFHVTGAGNETLATTISGFILGGSVSLANPGAIQLDGASYAQVTCNIIGQEDLPNAIGVLLRDADNVYIHDNTIHGSSQFPISTTLGPTPPVGGFGIVTSECLGSGHSDDAVIMNNLIALNSNAGIYFCSDGAGGHLIIGNTIRGNGRGVALQDTVDVLMAANSVQDDYYNGIELLETSQNNIITNNDIESHDGPDSTGVLLEGNGLLFPLNNEIAGNYFRRNTTNIYILGARRTLIGVDKLMSAQIEGKVAPSGHQSLQTTGNVMTADGSRTDIVLSLGNATGMAVNSASPSFGQPSDTLIKGNTILSNGPCSPTSGCAIRLTAGVISDVDATGNDWGVTSNDEVRAGIWDKFHDASLGQVVTFCAFGASVPNGGSPSLCPPPTSVAVPPTVIPYSPPAVATPQPAGTVTAPSSFASSSTAPVVITPHAAATATPAVQTPPPTAYIDPATGNYYVELTVCVSDSSGAPVPNDKLTLTLADAGGNTLASTQASTGTNGCFVGDVAATGAAASVPPASVSLTDSSGAVTTLAVVPGSPSYRSPAGVVQTG